MVELSERLLRHLHLLWRFEADGRLLTPPVIGDQTLYTVSFPGTVYALD